MPKFTPSTAAKNSPRVRFFEAAHASPNVQVTGPDQHGHVTLQNGIRIVVTSGTTVNGPCCFFSLQGESHVPVQDPKTYRQAAEFLGLDMD